MSTPTNHGKISAEDQYSDSDFRLLILVQHFIPTPNVHEIYAFGKTAFRDQFNFFGMNIRRRSNDHYQPTSIQSTPRNSSLLCTRQAAPPVELLGIHDFLSWVHVLGALDTFLACLHSVDPTLIILGLSGSKQWLHPPAPLWSMLGGILTDL